MSEPITRPNCYRGEVGEVCQSVPLPISENKADNRSSISSTVNTDNSVNKSLPWICVAIAAGFLALGLSASAMLEARRAEREASMLEYSVLQMDAKLIASGIKTADESIAKRASK